MVDIKVDGDVVTITMSKFQARKLIEKLEWAAIWDKVGNLYYRLKDALDMDEEKNASTD